MPSGVVELLALVESLAVIVCRAELARSSSGAASSLRAGVIDRPYRGASTGLVYGRSSTCPARNWRFAVVGAGFEEVELLDASGWIVLLDAVDYGGGLNGAPAGRFLDVSGWVGVLFPPLSSVLTPNANDAVAAYGHANSRQFGRQRRIGSHCPGNRRLLDRYKS